MSEGFCLEAPNGDRFSMRVLGYEFPDEELGPTEDNPADEFETGRFLVIRCEFSQQGRSWSASSPEMTTTELERLWNWLNAICDGDLSVREGVYFTERNLEFGFNKQDQVISAYAHYDFAFEGKSVELQFPLDRSQLRDALLKLKSDMRKYPGRPELK